MRVDAVGRFGAKMGEYEKDKNKVNILSIVQLRTYKYTLF